MRFDGPVSGNIPQLSGKKEWQDVSIEHLFEPLTIKTTPGKSAP
jgi:hypothetical protein